MEQACNTPLPWVCIVTAIFMEEDGTYYEEMLSTSTLGPFKLTNHINDVWEIVQKLTAEAKASGNPKHYQDTYTALHIHSPKLEAQLEDDEWLKRQAGIRAEAAWRAA